MPSTGPSPGIDPGRVRLPACWGNYEGPHTRNLTLDDILPLLYSCRVGALGTPWPTPRRAHEHRCFERAPLPNGMVFVTGVIDTISNDVEQPAAVDRIVRVAEVQRTPPGHRRDRLRLRHLRRHWRRRAALVWETLRALRQGADIASSHLY